MKRRLGGSESGASADPGPPRTEDTSGPDVPAKRIEGTPPFTRTFTSKPDTPPPQLLCPGCGRPLVYRQTVIGGVKPIERWDYFACRTCGSFVYRTRTRKLRSTQMNA